VTVERGDPDRDVLFQATITAEPDILAQCDDLELDVLPSRSRSSLREGRASVKAVLRLDQLVYLVGAGATVLLERLIDTRLPQDRVSSSEQARARLAPLRQARRPEH
jgi:hypothetical protein